MQVLIPVEKAEESSSASPMTEPVVAAPVDAGSVVGVAAVAASLSKEDQALLRDAVATSVGRWEGAFSAADAGAPCLSGDTRVDVGPLAGAAYPVTHDTRVTCCGCLPILTVAGSGTMDAVTGEGTYTNDAPHKGHVTYVLASFSAPVRSVTYTMTGIDIDGCTRVSGTLIQETENEYTETFTRHAQGSKPITYTMRRV